jgi:serine/threonine protein kinase
MDNDSSSNSERDDIIGKVFFKKYQCIKKLGEGSFGRIYEAIYKDDHYALKFENLNRNSNLLESEASIMNYLKGPNIPFVKSFGTSGNYNILIMQLMGKSLEDLINQKKTFSIKTVCLLGYQMITILEYIHNKHIVHRDIKPDNFVMGLDSLAKKVYLLDFGLAKKYRSSVTLVQYPLINKKKLTGTARYASINALRGYEQSRRDDLEAVGYVLMYFLRGNLPWQGLPGKNKEERYKKILQKKIDTSSYDLCVGFPEEFEKYIEYTRKMEYCEQPLYDKLRENFVKVIENINEDFDYIYDWSTDEEKEIRRKEYLEELNAKKTKKNSSIAEEVYLSTKNGIETKIQNSQPNEEEGKDINKIDKIDKYLEEEIIHKTKTKDLKNNYKFATKESSLEGNNNNYKRLNNNIINGRKNSRHRSSNHNHNNNRRNDSKENENKIPKDNEEVCCTEACIIF